MVCFALALKSPERLHFVASYSSGVFLKSPEQLICLDSNPQNSYISYILLLLIQVACCGLFCIRLKSPEQLHFVASYSSGVLWFALHQVEIPRTVTFCCFFFKWRVVVGFALDGNPQNSYILLLLIQVACCGLSCIRLNCYIFCFLFKWRVVVCFALG